jgi:hypothetical protein
MAFKASENTSSSHKAFRKVNLALLVALQDARLFSPILVAVLLCPPEFDGPGELEGLEIMFDGPT